MDYRLAKQLKDAGFVSNGQAWCEELKEVLPAPTLEELIEACGKYFISLEQHAEGHWATYKATDSFKTPTEAVARLWFALKEKGELEPMDVQFEYQGPVKKEKFAMNLGEKISREQIINALSIYHRTQGIAFMSEQDAIDYFRGLTELIESLIEESSSL